MPSPVLRLGPLPPVRISLGTLVTIALVAVLVHPAILASGTVGAGGAAALALVVGLLLIVSVLLHEAAHALVAMAAGGQVDHIALTLWGGHTQYRGREVGPVAAILISLAGPATNAVLSVAAGLGATATPLASPVHVVLAYLSTLNGALAVFNLLPGLPMDGGRALEGVLTAITRRRHLATAVTAWIGRGIAVLVILVPLLRVLRAPGTLDVVVLLWAVIIAGTLWQGAAAALAQSRGERSVERLTPQDVARPVVLLTPDASAAQVPSGSDPRTVLVLDAQGIGHRVDPAALAAVPAAAREATPISAVTTGIGPVGRLRTGESGSDMVARMMHRPSALYLLLDPQDRVIGTVATADVNARLR